jgi:hypothetical protein
MLHRNVNIFDKKTKSLILNLGKIKKKIEICTTIQLKTR